jgi:hypothetical protein
VRIAIEERVAMSPDALTGMEANLRFNGQETMFHAHLRPPHRLAELDLPAPQRRRRKGRAQGLRQGRQGRLRLEPRLSRPAADRSAHTHTEDTNAMTINYSEKIPNNVNLGQDRTLQRALEQWQPNS